MLIITEAGNEYLVSHYTCCSSLFILEIFSEKKLAEESDDNQMQCVILDRILVLKNCLQTIAKKQKSYVAFTETGFYLLSLIWVQTYCGKVIKHMPFPSFEIHLPPPLFFLKTTVLPSRPISKVTSSVKLPVHPPNRMLLPLLGSHHILLLYLFSHFIIIICLQLFFFFPICLHSSLNYEILKNRYYFLYIYIFIVSGNSKYRQNAS